MSSYEVRPAPLSATVAAHDEYLGRVHVEEGDRIPVRRPIGHRVLAGRSSELLRRTTVEREQEQLSSSRLKRVIEELTTVRREGASEFVSGASGEPNRVAATYRDSINGGISAQVGVVDEPPAVWRDAHAL